MKSLISRSDIRKACPYVFPSHLSIKKEFVTLKGLKGEHVPKIKIVLVGIRRFLIQFNHLISLKSETYRDLEEIETLLKYIKVVVTVQ